MLKNSAITHPAQPLGIAVIGAGYWGPNLVRAFSGCEYTKVHYICDLDISAARKVAKRSFGVVATDNLDEVLRDATVEAVAIATPVATHFPLAKAALQAGKHVLIEKPLAHTVAEGEELVALANQRRLRLMCDHTFCYTGAVRFMRDAVRSGQLGELLYFDSVRVNLGLFQSDVNVLWDLCPHDLSIIDYILPKDLKPIAVAAHGVDAMNTGYESVAYLSLFFERPFICHIHANWLAPVKVRMTLLGGTSKMIVWDDNNSAERVKIYDKGVHIENADRKQILVSYRHGEARIPILDNTEALVRVADEFALAIREDRPGETDGEAGLRILKILEAAGQSLRARGIRIELFQKDANRKKTSAVNAVASSP